MKGQPPEGQKSVNKVSNPGPALALICLPAKKVVSKWYTAHAQAAATVPKPDMPRDPER
jgi:hypothetical protein